MYNQYLVADLELLKEVANKIKYYKSRFGQDKLIEKMDLIDHVLNDSRTFEKCIFDILIGNTSANDPFEDQLKECQAHIQDDIFYYKDLCDTIQREEDRLWDPVDITTKKKNTVFWKTLICLK